MHDAYAESAPWKATTLGKVVSRVVNGGTPPTDVPRFWKGITPWITGADFTERGLSEFRRFVSQEAIGVTATNVIDQGELLLVTRTGVGKLAIAPCDVAISQDVTGVYTNRRQADVGFLYQRMRQGVDDLKRLNQGTSINGIIRKDLLNYPLRLPPLGEQRSIAEILSTVDDAIEQTEALVAKTQQIKAGLMHDLFTRGVLPNGQLRPPREQAPELYTESPLGWIPNEWDVQPIGVLFRRRMERGRAGLQVMSVTMTRGLVPRASVDRRVESNLTPEEHLLVAGGDIAYNMMRMWQGVLGRATQDCLVSPAYVVMSPTNRIDSRFAEGLLSLPESIARFKQMSYGIVDDRLRLYAHDLLRIDLAYPRRIEEQRNIADRCESIQIVIGSRTTDLRKLRQLKTGLMHDLLTGRVRVPVKAASTSHAASPEPDVASVAPSRAEPADAA